ncbi:TniQ family protein [Paucibacter sp. R3-3]|uniref:TniQ family protein n=1 Tax=Roseateles agri TaxID=3098619 RepID=A0ABU5DQX8_9BURK|nr:TniQ family protein [Paucibacter sp. R3-3]MDY0748727.1 TniQ family protein [Paucibacter sp. R3-3]
MYIPKMLPEELLFGYRGRIRFLNDLADGAAVTHALNNLHAGRMSCTQRSELAFTELIAEHNKCSIHDVVIHHTMWPYAAAIDRPAGEAAVEAFAQTQAGRTSLMRGVRRHAWLCKSCIEEDLAFWHVSYWRRSHQLPGALWCDKHQVPLWRCSLAALEEGPPDHHLDRAQSFDTGASARARQNRHVQRCMDVFAGMLEAGPVVDRALSSAALIGRAVALSLCRGIDDAPVAMTFLVRDRLPEEWLQEAFPKSIKWEKPVIGSFEAICNNSMPLSVLAVAVVASLLSDSFSDAMHLLDSRARIVLPAAA